MRLSNRKLSLAVIAAALLPLGCNEANTITAPATVPAVNLAGTWTGTFRSDSAQCAASPASATLQQQGAQVSGSFKAESCGIAGSVRGTVHGNVFAGEVNMAGCTGGAISGTIGNAGLTLSVGDFFKELVAGDREVLPGGTVTLQR